MLNAASIWLGQQPGWVQVGAGLVVGVLALLVLAMALVVGIAWWQALGIIRAREQAEAAKKRAFDAALAKGLARHRELEAEAEAADRTLRLLP